MATRKRGRDALDEDDSFRLKKLVAKIKEAAGRERIAKVLLSIAQQEGLDPEAVTETIPPFSQSCWDKVARKFRLDASRDILQLDAFSIPRLSLPPSFHSTEKP